MAQLKLLNQNVMNVLNKDRELMLMFACLFGRYDIDIDPIHSPDWCESAAKEEQNLLNKVIAIRKVYV